MKKEIEELRKAAIAVGSSIFPEYDLNPKDCVEDFLCKLEDLESAIPLLDFDVPSETCFSLTKVAEALFMKMFITQRYQINGPIYDIDNLAVEAVKAATSLGKALKGKQ